MKGVSTTSRWCQRVVNVSMLAVVLLYLHPVNANDQMLDDLHKKHVAKRNEVLKKDKNREMGASLELSAREEIVNEFMLKEKKKLMSTCQKNNLLYWPAASFYVSKPKMEKHDLFKIIKKMPKGGLLHAHSTAVVSLDWIIGNLTHRKEIWFCSNGSDLVRIGYFNKVPRQRDGCTWKSASDTRNETTPDEVDKWLRRSMSYLSTDPLEEYKTIGEVWKRFQHYFGQVSDLLSAKPVKEDYYRQLLKEAYDDNVQYLELRSSFYSKILGQNGEYDRTATHEQFLDSHIDLTKEFQKEHPDFIGTKFIINGKRYQGHAQTKKVVEAAIRLRKSHPRYLLGFDLVSQEDPLNSLMFYMKEILYPAAVGNPRDVPFFFHAGETNYQGTEADENLADAILFPSTKRIGHAFALVKHPHLMELVKEKGIGIECNPISNQVLGLVKDMRNHAVTPLMADDFPVTVASDDPAVWEAAPLSHDFFVAFMSMAGQGTGLKFLKQLAINSINYSGMEREEKVEALCKWETKWNAFIEATVPFTNDTQFGPFQNSKGFKCQPEAYLLSTGNDVFHGSGSCQTTFNFTIQIFVFVLCSVYFIQVTNFY